MGTKTNFFTECQKIMNSYLRKCRNADPKTWMTTLLIIALLCIAALVAPKFTSAEDPFNIPDPCEMAEMAQQWLEFED